MYLQLRKISVHFPYSLSLQACVGRLCLYDRDFCRLLVLTQLSRLQIPILLVCLFQLCLVNKINSLYSRLLFYT
jgi:hypothetical protein